MYATTMTAYLLMQQGEVLLLTAQQLILCESTQNILTMICLNALTIY